MFGEGQATDDEEPYAHASHAGHVQPPKSHMTHEEPRRDSSQEGDSGAAEVKLIGVVGLEAGLLEESSHLVSS